MFVVKLLFFCSLLLLPLEQSPINFLRTQKVYGVLCFPEGKNNPLNGWAASRLSVIYKLETQLFLKQAQGWIALLHIVPQHMGRGFRQEIVGEVKTLTALLIDSNLVEVVTDGNTAAYFAECRQLLSPFGFCSEVREKYDIPIAQRLGRPEVTESSGGKPKIVGHEVSGDDGGLFAFDNHYSFVGSTGQEVFSKETLAKVEILETK